MVSINDFNIIETIGYGSFSIVYHAVDKNNKHYALKKIFWNNSPERILKELKWSKSLNHPNIIKVYAAFRKDDQCTIVLEYVKHVHFRELICNFENNTIKAYMRGLISALSYLHSKKIVHRDIKPSNFLFDIEKHEGFLIDFGLCEENYFLSPSPSRNVDSTTIEDELMYPHLYQGGQKMMANRAGTRGFRAPEVLMAAWNQSPAIDIWSAGVILLSILTSRYPFFKSDNDMVSICEIASIVGSKRLEEAAMECGRRVRFPREYNEYNLRELCLRLNFRYYEMNLDEKVFDLLSKMLEPSPSKRFTADQCLSHPFFS